MRRTLPLVVGFALVIAGPAGAQEKRITHEWGLQLTGTTGRPAFLGAGPVWAWRPGIRDRLLLHSAIGGSEHQTALRLEASWHFLLSPQTRKGVGAYLGGGIAGQFAQSSHGWLMLSAGVEQNPAAGRGWMAEVGLGGGVRFVVGFRWRR